LFTIENQASWRAPKKFLWEEHRDRSGKPVYLEEDASSNDERSRFKTSFRRNDEDDIKKVAANDKDDVKEAVAAAGQKVELRSGKSVYLKENISSNDERARFETRFYRRNDGDDVTKAAADARLRNRSDRIVYVKEDATDSDEKVRFEASWRRRNDEDVKKAAADARRKAEERRSYEGDVKNPAVDARRKAERRDRSGKFVYLEGEATDSDEKVRFEASWRRRNDEDVKKAAADARRKAEDRRTYEEPQHSHQRGRRYKLNDQTSEAMHHILHTRGVVDPRPSTTRTSSSREIRPKIHDRSPRRDLTETMRRSSARPNEHRGRKNVPTIVEWAYDHMQKPAFKHSVSPPADIHIPLTHAAPQRAYREASPPHKHHRTDSSPTSTFRS